MIHVVEHSPSPSTPEGIIRPPAKRPDRRWSRSVIFAYTTAWFLLSPIALFHLVWRGFWNRSYWHRWRERFGSFPEPSLRRTIWVHAVSVGETQAAAPLVRALLARYGDRSIAVTTTTPTGSDRVRALFGDKVFHVYVPYDLPGPVRRFLDRVRPELSIVIETELWPNLFRRCSLRGIPLIVANARLSDKSLKGYRRIRPLLRDMLGRIDLVAARGPKDAERFKALGAVPERTRVLGNLKFDIELPDVVRQKARELRGQWGSDRPVWVAGSTHEGEEAQILDCFQKILEDQPTALLILVPRHPERFDRVARLCEARGLATVRRSTSRPCTPETSVLLGDTMGELILFYAASDVAFVGGSLVPVGGHNMLEATALGVPVVVGPYLHNFEEMSEALFQAGGAREVKNGLELESAVRELLAEPGARERMAKNGLELIETNRGALDRLLKIIDEMLGAAPDASSRPSS
jgi:3-deoxy-D-manno-octulosonic-acid transferase